MKHNYFLIFSCLFTLFCFSQTTTITSFNTLIKPNHNYGLSNPLWDQSCLMTYDAGSVDLNGAAFTFDFVNPGGGGFKGYPSGTIGGFKQGSTYSPGNLSACGLPIKIQDLNNELRIKWKVFQQNASDLDDKWWATINVIFDGTDPSLQPVNADRDFDLVIQMIGYEQETFEDVSSATNTVYWYFARNTDFSLKTLDLYLDGDLYQFAVRYKFFNYPIGDPNYDKNDKVHIKFIPINNNATIPNLDHSLKYFIDKGVEYKAFIPLSPDESTLFDAKVADPNLWIKSISAGYEVYTGQFTIGNTYFYTVLDALPPSAPLNLIASNTSSEVTLNWDAVVDDAFESYLVYRATNNGVYELLSDAVRTTSFIDTNVSSGNTYTYKVKAQDRSFNRSNDSNEVMVSFLTGITTPHEMVAKMGRGINVGNILSAPIEGNWAPALTESYIDDIYALRFKTVRIPIRFDNQTTPLSSVTYEDGFGNYIGSMNDYAVNSTYLDRIEEIVDWCLARNLVAIIDVHGDHWFWGSFNAADPAYKTGNDRLAAIDRFKAIWRDISVRFQGKSDDLIFEIMNEPYFDMTAADVELINPMLLTIIRTTNPTRKVIVTGGGSNSYNAPLQLSDSFLTSDDYLIATFHYYRLFDFTSSSQPTKNDFDWGTAADKNLVDTEFDVVYNWSLAKNIPIFLGEFGADNEGGYNYATGTYGLYGGPDPVSRQAYYEYVSNAAATRGFAVTTWDAGDQSNKTIYKVTDQNWVKEVRNAVLNATCSSSGIIQNADVECNYDYNWNTTFNNGANGRLYNAYDYESYNNSVSLRVEVTTPGSTLNSVILSNEADVANFNTNETYTIGCFAKGKLGTEKFRLRIKALVGGSYQYVSSPLFNVTTSYQAFSYNYTVPANASELTFQIVCGLEAGSYYFDDFSMISQPTCTVSTTWNGSGWSNGVPDNTKQAIFSANYTTTADIEACSIAITNNAVVTVTSSHTLTSYYEVNVTTGALLVVENEAALVQLNNNGNSGNILVKRASAPIIRLDYTAWSSPVSNQQLKAFSPNTISNRFYTYNPAGTTATTAYIAVDPTTNFEKAKGYMIRAANNWSPSVYSPFLGQFYGIPNNGVLQQNVVPGYNLIGNPYPSPLLADSFLNQNTNVNALYFWTHEVPQDASYTAQTNYASYTTLGGVAAIAGGAIPNGFIQTGQGFFVNVNTSGTVSFKNSQRRNATASTQFFRTNNDTQINRFRIELKGSNTLYNQILIGYPENATNNFDFGIDATLFENNQSAIFTYSAADANKLVIEGRHFPFENSDKVILGFNATQNDTYTLHIQTKEGLFHNQKIYLKDKYTNIITDLSSTDYSFVSEMGNFLDRFEILFKENISNVQEDYVNFTIIQNEYGIEVTSATTITEIEVFDLLGKSIQKKSLSDTLGVVNLQIKNVIYLVRVTFANSYQETRKIRFD